MFASLILAVAVGAQPDPIDFGAFDKRLTDIEKRLRAVEQATGAFPPAKDDAARSADPRDALVRVSRGDGSGSGTVIFCAGGKSVVLTAAHVLGGAGEPRVRGGGKWHPAKVIAHDQKADLAALLVDVELPAVKVSDAEPAAGTEVLMLGVTSLWSKGKVSGTEGGLLLFTADPDHQYSAGGDSGGGVFVKGELVGVHCGRRGPSGQQTSTPYCAGPGAVRGFLGRVFRRNGVAVVPVEPSATAAPAGTLVTGGIVTSSGRRLVPTGNGVYRYADDDCPNGACAPAPSAAPRFAPSFAPRFSQPSFGGCTTGRCPTR